LPTEFVTENGVYTLHRLTKILSYTQQVISVTAIAHDGHFTTTKRVSQDNCYSVELSMDIILQHKTA